LSQKEVNHTKIAVRVTVMNEVQFLLASEPRLFSLMHRILRRLGG
jgi:hypothetical protein